MGKLLDEVRRIAETRQGNVWVAPNYSCWGYFYGMEASFEEDYRKAKIELGCQYASDDEGVVQSIFSVNDIEKVDISNAEEIAKYLHDNLLKTFPHEVEGLNFVKITYKGEMIANI